MHLVAGHDSQVANWISQRTGTPICPPYTALGWISDSNMLGWLGVDRLLKVGFVFYRYEPGGNMDFTVAASGHLTRGVLTTVSDYVFDKAGCARLTSRPMHTNEKHCELLERAGFKAEGVQADYYGIGHHAVSYRLLKRQCRWLNSD